MIFKSVATGGRHLLRPVGQAAGYFVGQASEVVEPEGAIAIDLNARGSFECDLFNAALYRLDQMAG